MHLVSLSLFTCPVVKIELVVNDVKRRTREVKHTNRRLEKEEN